MRITLAKPVANQILTTCISTHAKEFSGFGFVKRRKNSLFVYEFVLLALGSETYTEIQPKVILPLIDRPDHLNMKCWLHCHPMGDGKYGQHNWSSTDERTIKTEPLGAMPELVKWSCSVVLTPRGWVGRIDNYVKGTTLHVPVYPKIDKYFRTADAIAPVPQAKVYQPQVFHSQSIRYGGRRIEINPENARQISIEFIEDYGLFFGDSQEKTRMKIANFILDRFDGQSVCTEDIKDEVYCKFINLEPEEDLQEEFNFGTYQTRFPVLS